MAENMAKQEKAPVVPIPTIDKPKALSRRTLIKGLAATGIVAGAGALGYVLTRPGEQSVVPPATAQPSVAPTEIPTSAPTVKPTEKPTPSPTERSLTDQEKIELARKVQGETLAKGEFRIPIPQQILEAGGKIEQGELIRGDERDLFAIVSVGGKEITFPALIHGKITQAGKLSQTINMIVIQVDSKNFGVLIPSSATIHVKEGQSVSLGEALFTVRYDPESPQQKSYEERAKVPKGTIAVLGLQDATAGPGKGFQELTVDKSLLKDSSGNFITIPTLKPNP